MNETERNEIVRKAADRILRDPNAALGLSTIAKLTEAGYIAYFAGGCVRDALLGKTPKDYDVATNARPDQIRQLLGYRRTLAIGAAFGVITVLGDRPHRQDSQDQQPACKPVEVATFRNDGLYSDGRHPDSVQFSDPEHDALRRDFTINGMFFDPRNVRVIDFVGGLDDLWPGRIRAIRDADERFQEDKLRLLRAVRFAATFGFELEPQTFQAVVRRAAEVTTCSGERIGAEMLRILSGSTAVSGIRLLQETGLAQAIMPKLAGVLSDPEVLEKASKLLGSYSDHAEADGFAARLALLAVSDADLTTCGRNADQLARFSESQTCAQQRLLQVVESWHVSNEHRDAATTAIADLDQLLVADQLRWSKLQPLLIKRYRGTSVEVARAVARLNQQLNPAIQRIDQALSLAPEQLDPKPLLTGNDLIAMGFNPNPNFRTTLQAIRDAQLDSVIDTPSDAQSLALSIHQP